MAMMNVDKMLTILINDLLLAVFTKLILRVE
jgi:hypothetical protein